MPVARTSKINLKIHFFFQKSKHMTGSLLGPQKGCRFVVLSHFLCIEFPSKKFANRRVKEP